MPRRGGWSSEPAGEQHEQQHYAPRRHPGPGAVGVPPGGGQGLRPAAHHLQGKPQRREINVASEHVQSAAFPVADGELLGRLERPMRCK